jgi:signal transduction histidine kinase
MRWPIQLQLLVPMLSVVVLTIAVASGATAYWRVVQVRHQREEHLQRVAASLTDATFPLGGRVLRQMSGLAGAELVLIDSAGKVEDATLEVRPADVEHLRRLAFGPQRDDGPPRREPVALAGRSYLGDRVPLLRRFPSGRSGYLLVLYPEDRWSAAVVQAAYPSLVAGAVMAAVVVLVTTVLARRFVQPIGQLRVRAAAIAEGDFRLAPPRRRDDEIGDLGESINRMAEQLGRYESEVRRSERLRTLGQLGAGMAHTLRNLAAGASMAVALHRRECPAGGDDESLGVADRQLKLIDAYLKRFLTLGQGRPVPHEPVDLAALVEEVLDLVGPACRHAGIDLRPAGPRSAVTVLGDRDSLRQVLVNLLLNAIEAAGRPGRQGRVAVALETKPAPSEPAASAGTLEPNRPRAVLTVRDSGPGPAADVAEQLFEPFVTEKPDGTGLGLYVSRQIVEAHGGTIAWDRRDEMTCFAVELPVAEPLA